MSRSKRRTQKREMTEEEELARAEQIRREGASFGKDFVLYVRDSQKQSLEAC
jgi:hypothetical protein